MTVAAGGPMEVHPVPRMPSLLFPLVALALLGGAGCSGIHAVSRVNVRTMSLSELLTEVEQRKESYRLPEGGLIVRVPAGSKVPLKLSLAMGFATVEPGDNFVRFDRDLFVHVAGRRIALSPDGERWADVGDWKALKRLLVGPGRGSISVGVGITKEGPVISAGMTAGGQR